MANTNTTKLMANLWNNWCNLPHEQRTQVAEKLGPVGNLLSIAANVQQFATEAKAVVDAQNRESTPPKNSNTSRNPVVDNDEDVIEAEYEEIV